MSNKFSSGTIRLLSRHVQEHERAKHGAYSRCVKERLSVLCSLTSISVIRLLLVETHNRVFVDQRIHRVLCSYVNGGSDISQIRSPVQLSSREPAQNVCFSRTPPCCCTCLPSKAFPSFLLVVPSKMEVHFEPLSLPTRSRRRKTVFQIHVLPADETL